MLAGLDHIFLFIVCTFSAFSLSVSLRVRRSVVLTRHRSDQVSCVLSTTNLIFRGNEVIG